MSIESLMQEQGGVGLAQILSFFLSWLQIASPNWMLYQINFLLKYPVLECYSSDGKVIPEDTALYE